MMVAVMTPQEFKAIRNSLDLTQEELGKMIGRNKKTIVYYESTDPNKHLEIPKSIELAMLALTSGKNRRTN